VGKKFVGLPFFCSHKNGKIENNVNFELLVKKKFWANLQRIIELSTQKIAMKLSKIWVWDPGSEIRDPEKPISDPDRTTDPGSGSATLGKRMGCLAGATDGRDQKTGRWGMLSPDGRADRTRWTSRQNQIDEQIE
jgi:hypothetical protein